MSVRYDIEVPCDMSADFWKFLNKNFNVIIIKKQHFIDNNVLEIKIRMIEIKKTK